MQLKKGDFIEIEFTGKLQEGGVFDSNIKEDLKKVNPNFNKNQTKPFVFCLGESMFLKGVEDFLIGKDIGSYDIKLSSDKAFGPRKLELMQRIPIKVFKEQKLNPIPGAAFNFDGKMGKIITASGGRVIVDFNNPLAGKDVFYKVKVLRKVEDINEKTKALIEFLFRQDLKFEIKDNLLVIHAEKGMKQFIELFKDKFKDMLKLGLEVKEAKEKSEKSSQ